MWSLNFVSIVQIAIIFVISIVVHEYAHAYVSYKLGDPTAKMMGRLTLNPMAHLDPIGTIMIFLVGFGWAKPVPINSMYYKDPVKGELLVSLAGPLSNLILATFAILIMVLTMVLAGYGINDLSQGLGGVFLSFLYLFAIINIILAVFNLVPIPPLDGFSIIKFIFPGLINNIRMYERQIGFALLILLFILIRRGNFNIIFVVAERLFSWIFGVFASVFY